MNRTPLADRSRALQLICEGMGTRATARVSGLSTNTVTKLVRDAGAECERRHKAWCKGIGVEHLQADELTASVGRKDAKAHSWIAIDPLTKFVVAWTTGGRTRKAARAFLDVVHEATSGSPVLVTDCFAAYRPAVEHEFGCHAVHVEMLKCTSVAVAEKRLHTSFVERMNLTVRTMNARFARRTSRASKLATMHHASLSLTLFAYNYIRQHSSLGMTPAMAAGVSETPLDYSHMARFAEAA